MLPNIVLAGRPKELDDVGIVAKCENPRRGDVA